MAKSRDYIYMDVLNIDGEKIGYIKDLLVDFNKCEVVGFKINPYKLMKKGFNVLREDIVYQKSKLIVRDTVKEKYLELGSIMNMHVVDGYSNVLGLVCEVLFDDEDYKIKAMSIRKNNLRSMFKNRKIFLIKDLIIGEEYILYNGKNKRISMECLATLGSRKNPYRDTYYEKA